MLQVAIGGANGTAQPGRNEDSNRRQPIRMDVQEAENLRLGKPEGVEDSSGLEAGVLAEFDHHLHAQSPFSLLMTLRQAEVRIDLATNGSHRPVCHNGERGAHVHARHETLAPGCRRDRHPDRPGEPRKLRLASMSASLTGIARPYLHDAG